MMSRVIDLYPWRFAPHSLSHPAGVSLPLEDPAQAGFLIPQLRHAVGSGRYCSDMIRALPNAVGRRDRVLVVGSGLGILSTLLARVAGVEKVLVMEPDIALAAFVEEVHRANGVPWVETVNAIPGEGRQGRIPLFVRHDIRASSLRPEDGPWRQVMLVPSVDLGLVVAEERIGLVVADRSLVSAEMSRQTQLGSTVRVLLGFAEAAEACSDGDALAATLGARAGAVEKFGAALMFGKGPADYSEPARVARTR